MRHQISLLDCCFVVWKPLSCITSLHLTLFSKIQSLFLTVTYKMEVVLIPCGLPNQRELCICIAAASLDPRSHPKPGGSLPQGSIRCDWQSLRTPFDLEPLTSEVVNYTEHLLVLANLCSLHSSRWHSNASWQVSPFLWECLHTSIHSSLNPSILLFLPPMIQQLRTQGMEAKCQGRTTDAL